MCLRRRVEEGLPGKSWATSTTLGYDTCHICLVQPTEKIKTGTIASWAPHPDGFIKVSSQLTTKMMDIIYNHEILESFNFEPILFNDVKKLGFCSMHKRIRVMENLCKMSEHKYARLFYPDQYFSNLKSKSKCLENVRSLYADQFKTKLGIKYFVPDPINGGNTNTGPMSQRLFNNYYESSKILQISPETLRLIRLLLNMINSKKFVNVHSFKKIASSAFRHIMCDYGSWGKVTATTHALLTHGAMFIHYVQHELGMAPGDLTENSLEMGNKQNKQFKKMFARRNCISTENSNIFKRRLLMSDPVLIIEGEKKQLIRRGNIRRTSL